MDNKYKDIGDRLRKFGEDNFENMVQFSKYLGMSHQNLNQYLSGKSRPGPDIIERLIDLGCNINWLFTGIQEKVKLENSVIYQQAKQRLAVLERLEHYGITTPEQIDNLCCAENIAKDVQNFLTERFKQKQKKGKKK